MLAILRANVFRGNVLYLWVIANASYDTNYKTIHDIQHLFFTSSFYLVFMLCTFANTRSEYNVY